MSVKNLSMHEPIYRYSCRVIYGDTDSGGVVYYANYLRYFEAARTEFMREHVTSYRSMEGNGLILPVVECHVRYKASARYDDLLIVETCLLDVRAVSCRFNYRIVREADKKVLIQGYTVHAVVNRDGRLTKMPAALVESLKKNSVPSA